MSFTTKGGTVVVSCAGTRLTLDSITPRDGWRFQTETQSETGQGRLEVHFTPRTGGEEEVEITIGCVGGNPTRHPD